MVANEEITINIGKNGLSDSVINEIKVVLKKYKQVKIKFLPSASERTDLKNAVNQIINKTKAKFIKKIGFTILIKKNS